MTAKITAPGVAVFEEETYTYSPGRWVGGFFMNVPTRTVPGQSYTAHALPWKGELVITIPAETPSFWARIWGERGRPAIQETWRKNR